MHEFPPCQLRIVETALPEPPTYTPTPTSKQPAAPDTLTTTLLLEEASTGVLFAACPYTTAAAVDAAIDSSRFFALRVVGDGGRKAVLGIGFEERSEAFDFGVALQEARKVLGLTDIKSGLGGKKAGEVQKHEDGEGRKKDWSLKVGESIHIDLGRRARKVEEGGNGAFGAIAPPSAGIGVGFLPPPPSAREVREEKRREAKELGFDDGEFGEFQ